MSYVDLDGAKRGTAGTFQPAPNVTGPNQFATMGALQAAMKTQGVASNQILPRLTIPPSSMQSTPPPAPATRRR